MSKLFFLPNVKEGQKSLQDALGSICSLKGMINTPPHQIAVRHAKVSMTDKVLETLLAGLAEFYLADPFGLQDLSGGETARGMRVQDGVDDVAASRAVQRFDWAISLFVATAFEIAGKELVFILLGQSPEVATGSHGHVDDAAGPHVDGARVEFLVNVFLRRDVGRRAAET